MRIQILREAHEPPEWAARILERVAGKNPFGEPVYRLVWGQNRMEWVGGEWTDRDANTKRVLRKVIELRQVPKYSHLGVNKWFVERWYPPEHFGTRAAWEARTIERVDGISIPALGPYPSRGEYDHFYTMEGPDGKFRQLTVRRVEWIASIIRDAERMRVAERDAADKAQRERNEAESDAMDLAILKDAGRPFNSEPTVSVP